MTRNYISVVNLTELYSRQKNFGDIPCTVAPYEDGEEHPYPINSVWRKGFENQSKNLAKINTPLFAVDRGEGRYFLHL